MRGTPFRRRRTPSACVYAHSGDARYKYFADREIHAHKREECVVVTVEDTGVGISEEKLDKMFSAFFTTKAKGQGLGLAVCKRLAEAHGGTIHVKSKVGKGSVFTVEIPTRKTNGSEVR